jgi:hypothetical protein
MYDGGIHANHTDPIVAAEIMLPTKPVTIPAVRYTDRSAIIADMHDVAR